jgi:hypothetical protein
MTPQEFMDEIALPTVAEFKRDPRSRRLAYLACIATFHIKDHLKSAGQTSIETTMRAACGDSFDVVRAICNGTKHVQTDASHPIPFVAGTDWYRPPARLGQMILGVSRLGDPHGGREIGMGQQRRDIYPAVRATLAAYCASFPPQLGTTDLSQL